jgi:hypothetical protein
MGRPPLLDWNSKTISKDLFALPIQKFADKYKVKPGTVQSQRARTTAFSKNGKATSVKSKPNKKVVRTVHLSKDKTPYRGLLLRIAKATDRLNKITIAVAKSIAV